MWLGGGSSLLMWYVGRERGGNGSDNSPALQCWDGGHETDKVPQGTTERFFRPCGTLFLAKRAVPSAEALGYCRDFLAFASVLSANRMSMGSSVPAGLAFCAGRVVPGADVRGCSQDLSISCAAGAKNAAQGGSIGGKLPFFHAYPVA
jgi:hypothetical protein